MTELAGNAHLAQLEQVLAAEVRPALSSHAGTIAITEVDDARRRVTLQLRGPCGTCYFRRGCEANMIRPALQERLGEHGYQYRIKGGAHRVDHSQGE